MRIYLAAPLFNDIERSRNVRLRDLLKDAGHSVYLPQEDGGLLYTAREPEKSRKRLFEADVEAIKNTDAIVCVLDGRVPDEGMCVELGIAYALNKKCIGYQTDARRLDQYGNSLMIDGCLAGIAHTDEELLALLS